jgi:hypothetical protein
MHPIAVFMIIAVALVGYLYIGQLSKQAELPSEQPEEPLSETKESVSTKTFLGSVKSATEPSEPKSTISINTYIISDPEEGEVLEETNRVTFEFKARVSPEETEGRVIFETKVEGVDEDWRETSSSQRTINFPSGPKEYTFLVRAKIKDTIDKTPAERTFKINTSPYFEKIKISSVRSQTSSRSSLITLSTYLKSEEEINITGWKIKGKTGSFTIPGGIEKYNPYYNPVPGEDIFVKRSDRIYLSGASNPLGRGRNFRPNKCLGYFTNYRDFPISLPKNCPKPEREEISHLDPCCQEFILRLGRCEIPDYSSNSRISTDSECVDYLNDNFNYGGCYRNYSRDEDFVGENWHIYMNRNIVVSDACDTLYLRDQNGLLVDKYSYGRPVCK